MSNPVRIFRPANTLNQVLTESGGRSGDELVTASEKRVGAMAPELRTHAKACVARLAALRDEGAEALTGHIDELNHVAMAIAEVSGAAERPALGDGARGLLAMLTGLEPAGARAGEALKVHIDALELLITEPQPTQTMTEAVLRQLAEMRVQLGCSE